MSEFKVNTQGTLNQINKWTNDKIGMYFVDFFFFLTKIIEERITFLAGSHVNEIDM